MPELLIGVAQPVLVKRAHKVAQPVLHLARPVRRGRRVESSITR